MPWSGSTFSKRHNKKLRGARANKAARVANAILRKSGDEGKAIRIANAMARKGKRKRSRVRRSR